MRSDTSTTPAIRTVAIANGSRTGLRSNTDIGRRGKFARPHCVVRGCLLVWSALPFKVRVRYHSVLWKRTPQTMGILVLIGDGDERSLSKDFRAECQRSIATRRGTVGQHRRL